MTVNCVVTMLVLSIQNVPDKAPNRSNEKEKQFSATTVISISARIELGLQQGERSGAVINNGNVVLHQMIGKSGLKKVTKVG